MKKLPLIIIASFLIAILPFFILLLSGDFMSLLLISFLLFFPFVFLILNYIYKRASHNQLKAVYHNLVSLKNVKKKQFSANDNAGLFGRRVYLESPSLDNKEDDIFFHDIFKDSKCI